MERDFRGIQLNIFDHSPKEDNKKQKEKLSGPAMVLKSLLDSQLERIEKLPGGIDTKNLHEAGFFAREFETDSDALREIKWINDYVSKKNDYAGKKIVELRIKDNTTAGKKYMMAYVPIVAENKTNTGDNRLRRAA